MDYKCVDKDCKFLDQANKHARKCGCGKILVSFCEHCEKNISSSNFSKHMYSCKNKKRKNEKNENKTSSLSQQCMESIEQLKKVNFNYKPIIHNTRKVKIIWIKRNKDYDNRFTLPINFKIPKELKKDIISETDLEIDLEEYK